MSKTRKLKALPPKKKVRKKAMSKTRKNGTSNFHQNKIS